MYKNILERQKMFFLKNFTKKYAYRINSLNRLYEYIKLYENELLSALEIDLGKNATEAYVTEVGLVYRTINFYKRNLKKFMKPKKIVNDILLFPDVGYIMSEPLGSVLIIGPFNYPVQTTLEPLIGAIASGNCVVLKPSEKTPHVSTVLENIIKGAFSENYATVIQGGKEVNEKLINLPFDFIFFTGSQKVGKIVMEAASRNLVPVCLELGGKSPTIVDKTADIRMSARRIAWAKYTNVGQTCVAPDHVFVEKEIIETFVEELVKAVDEFYNNKSYYGKIIDIDATSRLVELLEGDRDFIVHGGSYDMSECYIEPTILKTDFSNIHQLKSMEDEIFGPILPVISYNDSYEIVNYIKNRPKPLALYLFTNNKDFQKRITEQISYGSGAINTALVQVSSSKLPFGGVGESGMGDYHGKYSFELFSNQKSVVKARFKISSVNIMYPPYSKLINLVKKILS